MKNMKYGCMRAWIDTEKLPSLKERKISTNAALLVFCFLQIWWLWLRFGSKNSTAGEIIKLLTELLLLILLQSSPHWTMKKHKSTAPTMLWDMRRFYGENYKHPFHSSAKFYFSFINFVWKTENWGRESLKHRFLLNCHKYSFIKMWNNQIFYIFAFMDNQTAADDFWHQTNVSWILQRVTFPLITDRKGLKSQKRAKPQPLHLQNI